MAVNSFNAQNPPVTTKGDVFTFSTIPTRLGVGANDTVLTADSSTATGLKWAAVSAGGMTQLATGSFSSTTTTISGLSGSYNDLMIYIYDIGNSTGGDSLRMRLNGLSTSIYGIQVFTATSVGMTSASASFNLQYSSNTADSMILVHIPGYANTVTHKFINYMHGTGDSNLDLAYGCGVCRTTNAITELSFFWDAGYTFNRGTYTIYGVK